MNRTSGNRTLGAAALAASVLIASTLGYVPHGWAQANPSADQLINALKPTTQSLRGPTRGIRRLSSTAEPATDTPAPAPAPSAAQTAPRPQVHASAAPMPAPASEPKAEAPSANLYVEFASGSAELTPQAMTTLDELGKALSSNTLAGYRFRIEGHTDTVGSKDYNLSLSERRAASVASYIERKFGVTEARLVPIGLGSAHPAVPTPDQTPEARNRRVQVVNLGA